MDKNTYKKLLTAHQDRIYSYVLYCLRNRDDAQDVTQEVFLRLWDRADQLDLDKVEGWLVRVAHNLVIDHSRRRTAQRAHLGQPDSAITESLPTTDDSWSNPERTIQAASDRQEILDAMATLPTESRSIMLLHYFQGQRLQDIAASLGKKTSTVKVQLHRARKALRLVLDARLSEPLAAKRETG